jgi:hypothetical protein
LSEVERLKEENSREYQRGRKDEGAAIRELSPTWEKDVVPLRQENERLRWILKECREHIEILTQTRCVSTPGIAAELDARNEIVSHRINAVLKRQEGSQR